MTGGRLRQALFRPTILLAIALMAVIVMMVLPMPAIVLDIGLAASFALAILVFTVTLFIERPLDFSAFPTVLLAALMLRLSLNVSSTKLIIGQGHTGTGAAGAVIEGFAMFVMGGSLLLGLVVFGVLLIVNFIVITQGAARMAEVGARFALDAMPGKQLAIDSDVASGAITHEQAKARRETEQAETTFFGSLDGASKFVKGDAVAGLLITLLNLLVGLAAGTLMHGMPLGRAFETYAILTVGDGLVNQIPAVILSIAAALLLARGGARGSTDLAFFGQLGGHPAALGTVAGLLGLFALLPGLPAGPFLAAAAGLGGVALWRTRHRPDAAAAAGEAAPAPPAARPIGDVLDLDELHVELAEDLIAMALDPATGLDGRIVSMRAHVAERYGVILPEIRITDSALLPPGGYVIRIHGVEQARDRLEPGRVMVLLRAQDAGADLPAGREVAEPVYGAPARWIDRTGREAAALTGHTVVAPAEVLATHLLEVIRRNLARLMTLKALRRLLDEVTRLSDPARAEANRRMIEDLIPEKVPVDLLLAVLRLLLEEQVSIRNLALVLEAVAEARPSAASAETIAEHVRHRLGFQISAELRREDGTIPLIQLAPAWEEIFERYETPGETGAMDVALPPEDFGRLAASVAEKIGRAAESGAYPGIVTSARRRRFLRAVLAAKGVTNPVLSFEEVATHARPALLGIAAP